ncbi:apoptosis-inducing factor 2 isoform X2 [Gadus macrocephalus]|uniref:apoptosis-inducing factor 2 isoform X2 n=1 Tax=Gadus macrocephalus TaxID=80720 RepID=UPI0028CB4905|nr:apoptosis-inducing factor 2 isoform X2 [Gadus macrocephalus]
MGAQGSVPEGVHVVVIGGGFGGIAAAQQLKSSGVTFTLIDLKDAFHHNVGALRASVQDGFAQKTFIPYAETFGESFTQGRVVLVEPEGQRVVLEDGQEVLYSHLILCTGTEGPFPGKYTSPSSTQTAVQRYQDLLQQVVLVHSRIPLADPGLLASVRQQAKEVLMEKGVELVLGQKLLGMEGVELNVTRRNQLLTTDQGTEIRADLVISCTGQRANSAAYASGLADWVAEDGSLKVNPHLQVGSHPNIYAIGDCANIQEPKMAYHAGLHAAIAVSNITNSLSGKDLCTYSTGSVTMLVALGRDAGVGQFNGCRLPRIAVVLGKSKDLLLWKSWRDMGQTAP